MADSKNNMPVIAGVVALLLVGGGAAYYFSGNMTKDEAATTAQAPATSDAAATAAAPTNSGEPPATDAEKKEAEAAAATFEGVEVKPGNPVVATVDGRDITRVDVFRYIKLLPANVQQLPPQAVYPMALEQVIGTRLVQNKAEEAGLENDPEVLEQLNMAKQQIIRTVYVQRALDKEITEASIKAKYNETIGNMDSVEELRASHILVDSESKAKDLIAKIEGGADFAKLAAENSSDPGNKNEGGDLGYFAKADMVPDFSEPVFKMGKGELSKTPIKTQFGWHVVKVVDKREREKPSFEEVKPAIVAELRREKLETLLGKMKTAAKIDRFDINGDPIKEAEVAPASGDAAAPTAPAMDTPAAAPEAAPAQ